MTASVTPLGVTPERSEEIPPATASARLVSPVSEQNDQARKYLLDVAFAFTRSKALFSAIEIGLFNLLDEKPCTLDEILKGTGLSQRAGDVLLDMLCVMGLLSYSGGRYSNSLTASDYLSSRGSSYLGDYLKFLDMHSYSCWGRLHSALGSGLPQSREAGGALYERMKVNPSFLSMFLRAMRSRSRSVGEKLAEHSLWRSYNSVVDVGSAAGDVLLQILDKQRHLNGVGFDLPEISGHFNDNARKSSASGRANFVAGDFFKDDLPPADVIILGHVLHNWGLDQRIFLLAKAHDAVRPGGKVIVYEAFNRDGLEGRNFSCSMSLNMLLETYGGSEFGEDECTAWMVEVGFSHIRSCALPWPDRMIIGTKPT